MFSRTYIGSISSPENSTGSFFTLQNYASTSHVEFPECQRDLAENGIHLPSDENIAVIEAPERPCEAKIYGNYNDKGKLVSVEIVFGDENA